MKRITAKKYRTKRTKTVKRTKRVKRILKTIKNKQSRKQKGSGDAEKRERVIKQNFRNIKI